MNMPGVRLMGDEIRNERRHLKRPLGLEESREQEVCLVFWNEAYHVREQNGGERDGARWEQT